MYRLDGGPTSEMVGTRAAGQFPDLGPVDQS